jgi:hypothetical protein
MALLRVVGTVLHLHHQVDMALLRVVGTVLHLHHQVDMALLRVVVMALLRGDKSILDYGAIRQNYMDSR